MCCDDGYIINCYGPFAANQNDKSIIEYILKNDQDLLKILLTIKNLFIDRGKSLYFYNLILKIIYSPPMVLEIKLKC